MLHHDYAACHTAISVNKVLTKKGIPVVPKPPYSPDQSLCDFFLFPKLKFHLKGHHFGTVDNIQKVVTDQLRATQRLPTPLLEVEMYRVVCGFPRELL
jgi:hypothetical protein